VKSTPSSIPPYELLSDVIYPHVEVGVDERGNKFIINKESLKGNNAGIRMMPKAFIMDTKLLHEYATMFCILHEFTIDAFAEDVWELLYDISQGTVY